MTKSILEVIQEVDKERVAEKRKLKFLPVLNRNSFKMYMNYIFNEELIFDDFSDIEYNPLDVPLGYGETNLDMLSSKVYIFLEDTKVGLKRKKVILAGMLESLQKDEAVFLYDVVMKRVVFKNLRKGFVLNMMPDLFQTRTKKI